VTSPDQGEKIVAEDRISFGQRQVPIPFELKFDPRKIDAKHLYVVSTRIFVGTQLRFMNSKQYRVLTQGHPAKADLVLTQVEMAK
jgi:putative lipoprotein